MAPLPDLWPAQAVYRLFPSDRENRSLLPGSRLGCSLAMHGPVHLQGTRCEPGLWRSEQKTQSQDVCFGFLLTQLILLLGLY